MLTTEFKNDRNHRVLDGTDCIGNIVQFSVGVEAGMWRFLASAKGIQLGWRDGGAEKHWQNALPVQGQ